MTGVAILSGVFVLYALLASRLDRLSITAPMVFVLAGVLLGKGVTDLIDVSITSEPVLLVVEVTLALLLFADASTIRLREVEDDARLPSRLLLIGLPLTIAFGTVIGALLFPAAGWAAAALIGSILAPTDAALGLAIFTNPAVPVRIRRALNVESGMNDGIATPFVALFLTVLVSEEAGNAGDWLIEAGKEIGLGLIVAVGVGVIGGSSSARLNNAARSPEVSEQLGIVSARAARLPRVRGDRRERIHRGVRRRPGVRRLDQGSLAPTHGVHRDLGVVLIVLRVDGVRRDLRRSRPDRHGSMQRRSSMPC